MSSQWLHSDTRLRLYARAVAARMDAAGRLLSRIRCAYCYTAVVVGRYALGGPTLLRAATIDHVVPRAAGGTNRHTNLVVACFRCNALARAYGGPADLLATTWQTGFPAPSLPEALWELRRLPPSTWALAPRLGARVAGGESPYTASRRRRAAARREGQAP